MAYSGKTASWPVTEAHAGTTRHHILEGLPCGPVTEAHTGTHRCHILGLPHGPVTEAHAGTTRWHIPEGVPHGPMTEAHAGTTRCHGHYSHLPPAWSAPSDPWRLSSQVRELLSREATHCPRFPDPRDFWWECESGSSQNDRKCSRHSR